MWQHVPVRILATVSLTWVMVTGSLASRALAQDAPTRETSSDTPHDAAPESVSIDVDVDGQLTLARSAIEDASFEDAEIALDRAASGTMDRERLLRWLELRALLAYADGRLGALEEALVGYATVAAGLYEPPASFPAPLRQRLGELADARIEIHAEPSLTAEGEGRLLVIPTQAIQDPGHLVRRIELTVSVDGTAPTDLSPGRGVPVPGDVHADVQVAYRALARGPGDAIVATLGDEAAGTQTLPGLPRSSDEAVIGIVVASAAVVVAGAVVIGWGVSDDWGRRGVTRIDGPVTAALFSF